MPIQGNPIDRRTALAGIGAVAAGLAMPPIVAASAGVDVRVNVIGCGIAGTLCARLVKSALGGSARVRVIAPDILDYTPPFSRTAEFLGAGRQSVAAHEALRREGIEPVSGRVSSIDPVSGQVSVTDDVAGDKMLDGDIIVAAGGVVENRAAIPGIEDHQRLLPAMWESSGPAVTAGWLDAVEDGHQIVVVAPPQPYRCPPAIYERVCLLGGELRKRGIRARIVIIDMKDRYPMQALFEAAYADYLDGTVEWIPAEFHGGIEAVDLNAGQIDTAFDAIRADWTHVVAAQRAPDFLSGADLADDDGYGIVDARTMQSPGNPAVYILGDAAAAGEMSKSADSALVHARLAAHAIVERVRPGISSMPDAIEDRCWTYVADNDAITLYGRYAVESGEFHAVDRVVSNVDDTAEIRADNAARARSWPNDVITTVFGGNI